MLRPNEIFEGTYRILREIGQGGVSQVYLAYHLRLQKYVVIKRIRSDFTGTIATRTEVDILKNLHHPNLPQVYDFLQLGSEVYTVMDYIEGQSLEELVSRHLVWPEKTLVRWLRQLLDVLEYLHTRRIPIIHSDIKPGNIILRPDGSLCLIDFNISLDGMGAGKIIGFSDFYAAPEQIQLAQARQQGQPCRIQLDGRTDLYSLAATFYHLVSGRCPMTGQRNPSLEQLAAGRYTPDFLQLLDRAMAWEPRQRWQSAKQMRTALERLHRKNTGFRSYLALQAASWLLSGLLLAAGLFCVVRGVGATQDEAYQADYSALSEAVRSGDDDLVLETANAILNRNAYQRILANSPQDHSAILHAIGDCYYNDGAYASAASYYRQAVDCADSSDPQLASYYCDAALALLLAGDTTQANSLLTQAEASGLGGAQLLLIQTAAALVEGDSDACQASAEALLDASSDSALCAQTCLTAAQSVTGQERLEWLRAANSYESTRQTLRQLGALCMELADAAETEEEGLAYRQEALEYYEALCDSDYAALEDQLNLGIVQLSLGDSASCVSTLLALDAAYPGDYRIEVYLAFAYYAGGDTANAASYGSAAWQHWQSTPELERDSAVSGAMEDLQTLKERLGF